ncbi:phosphatase PAP2 family protein [Limoniibacter endophyticus]|uniref:Phosphatase PAP2 family protein n=1 Tax=Limoniibacter endophyticus TaxID=1565040 RepID=A0A8J3DHG3_9HYPH|nr:phosphatase PAP2 family protein [Limoniibacter endophyticus]GHC67022.1 phosphatase PAP2 family protein [Limoniibacter endophyticus]
MPEPLPPTSRSTSLTGPLVIGAAICFIAFLILSQLINPDEPFPVDQQLILAFRSATDANIAIGPSWLQEAVRDVTALGSSTLLCFVYLVALYFLGRLGRVPDAIFLTLAVAGGQFLSTLLKLIVARPRPDILEPLMAVHSASFPSSHAMMSIVLYLTLASILAGIVGQMRVRIAFFSLAFLITFAIGISRLYLGVHWPSDVLGGWIAGGGWVLLCWLLRRWYEDRKTTA